MLPGGRRVSGTVLCTAEDLVGANAMPARHDDRDDDNEGDSDHEDDDNDV
jgi:hypothetical protein